MEMDIKSLVSQIQTLDGTLKNEANKAVNTLLTIRNWLIGYYLVEYEQKGQDRAKYGDKILQTVADSIGSDGFSFRNLKLFRQFFLAYPRISESASEKIANVLSIGQTPPAQFKLHNNHMQIGQTPSAQLQSVGNESLGNLPIISIGANEITEQLIEKLSFSHISLLLPLENAHKQIFYAEEAIKGTWSVRELKRQINSLLYERSGMSAKTEVLIASVDKSAEKQSAISFIKDIYTFEFLGLPLKDAVEESDLESALLDHLQQFLIEMGHGFCLEARQKRILIGDEYCFIDLIFYHRVLKCHVLIELKVDEFKHSNAGQLNTYINYYKKEVKLQDDNDPVGILLVTNKNDAMVEYAVAGMDEKLFIRKYMLALPDKHQLEAFIRTELKKL